MEFWCKARHWFSPKDHGGCHDIAGENPHDVIRQGWLQGKALSAPPLFLKQQEEKMHAWYSKTSHEICKMQYTAMWMDTNCNLHEFQTCKTVYIVKVGGVERVVTEITYPPFPEISFGDVKYVGEFNKFDMREVKADSVPVEE